MTREIRRFVHRRPRSARGEHAPRGARNLYSGEPGKDAVMITLEPIGYVRSARADLRDDEWGNVTARIELSERLGAQCLDGLEEFSHAEVIFPGE